MLGAEPLRARLCGNFGVGFNNIDVATAKARGIAVLDNAEAFFAGQTPPNRVA